MANAAALAVLVGLLRWPWFVERIYARAVGPTVSVILTSVTGLVPFSVGELVLPLMGLWLAVPVAVAMGGVARRRPGSGAAMMRQALRVAAVGSALAVAFYALWGLDYGRAGIVARQGWQRQDLAPGPEEARRELRRLAAATVEAANDAYREATGGTDLGRPTTLPVPRQRIDVGLEEGYEAVAEVLDWPAVNAVARGPVKPLLLSPVMSRLGLAGIYLPWTGEANVNGLVPPPDLPMAMAHEKAHQRGLAREDEANFVGFLASARSPHPYARYSAYLFAQRQLLRELDGLDPPAAAVVRSRRLPGVRRDVAATRAYWQRFQGPARDFQESFNDTYLEFNGVEDGIISYQRSLRLLVVFARVHGGSLVAPGPEERRGS